MVVTVVEKEGMLLPTTAAATDARVSRRPAGLLVPNPQQDQF